MRPGLKRGIVIGVVVVVALAIALPLALTGGSSNTSGAAKDPSGGALTVATVATQWPGLDPATDTQDAIDTQIMNAIYGQLFELNPSGHVVANLASGYAFSSNGLTVTIGIRKDVTFQNGSTFNAAAVAANIKRVLEPQFGCICDADFSAVKSITTSGTSTVVLHLSRPDASIIESFIGEAPNWTVSPTALASEPEATYAQHPVGAGPYEVVSNSASSQLVLKSFPHYWQGKPGLSTLTFVNVQSDQSALSSLQSGQVQLLLNMSTPQIIESAKPKFNVCVKPASTNGQIELNTKVAPFNNSLARQAVTEATNPEQLLKSVGDNFGVLSKVPTGPSSLFYTTSSEGYQGYNLAKAKAAVQKLGGLSVTLLSIDSPAYEQQAEAIQSQWEAAGIKVTISPVSLQSEISDFLSNSWQASPSSIGGNDPGYSIFGFPTRLSSTGTFSGTANSTLDSLINKAESTTNTSARQQLYDQIYQLYNTEDYGPLTYASNVQLVAAKDLAGVCNFPVFAIEPIINWEGVSLPS